MNTKKSIYICGPVSGTTDYIERFAKVEKELQISGNWQVVNPVRKCQGKWFAPESQKWETLMFYVLPYLSICTHIYLMHDWQDSYGARIEKLWAEKLGLIEIREGKQL